MGALGWNSAAAAFAESIDPVAFVKASVIAIIKTSLLIRGTKFVVVIVVELIILFENRIVGFINDGGNVDRIFFTR